jgi:hypothetical protein
MSLFIKRNFIVGELKYGKRQDKEPILLQPVIVRVEKPKKKGNLLSKLWPFGRKK